MKARWIFTPLLAGKPWNGNTVLSEPLGGSEAAVAYLAQALARKEQEVHVVTHGEPCVDFAGVHYHNSNEMETLVRQGTWDILVSSRWYESLRWNWQCGGRILWLHDLPSSRETVNCNLVVFISEFQRNAYGVGGATTIIGDGVDENLLKNVALPKERNENRLVWTSNPDRGAALAARIFQEARKRWPDLELHIYGRAAVYGWDASAEAAYLPRREDMSNVFLHEPLPRHSLLKEIAGSWAFFYPTFWPETFCMAALEAQSVGTPVIAPPYGALTESVKGGILTYDFLNAISQLRNKRRWEKLSVAGIDWAQDNTWQKQADRWIATVEGKQS